MQRVVGVVFRKAGKVYYFDPDGLELKPGDSVIVKTTRGTEFGEVVSPAQEMPSELIPGQLKKVVRRASEEDLRQAAQNKEREEEAFRVCQEKIAKHKLDMKLADVESIFDGSKMLFYFTSEDRVDFRDLVRDLASIFKTRIEMRQIGVRDEAKMIGGLGPCGRHLCCTQFAGDFEPVSIRMAKEQNLPLNPMKISGICGRLMCCLKYEYEVYKDFRGRVPKKGSVVQTSAGEGKIVEYNVPRERVTVQVESGLMKQVSVCEVCSKEAAERGCGPCPEPDAPDSEAVLSERAERRPDEERKPVASPGRAGPRRESSASGKEAQTPAGSRGKSEGQPKQPGSSGRRRGRRRGKKPGR
ncbi:MAG: stage 0 sporulation protein [Actinobacteria bacterium]|nr:MAG: stage 0 sporulation protein [Actinomycetota bacterium]